MMDGDGISLGLGGTAVGALCTLGTAWIKAKFGQKAKVEPVPLPVETHRAEEYVTREEFQRHVEKVEKRFEAGNTAFKELRKEITGMREDLHAGLGKITDRISPIAEACAANGAAIRILLNEEKR